MADRSTHVPACHLAFAAWRNLKDPTAPYSPLAAVPRFFRRAVPGGALRISASKNISQTTGSCKQSQCQSFHQPPPSPQTPSSHRSNRPVHYPNSPGRHTTFASVPNPSSDTTNRPARVISLQSHASLRSLRAIARIPGSKQRSKKYHPGIFPNTSPYPNPRLWSRL